MKVSQNVLAVLSSAEVSGSEVRLTGQLDRSLYVKTNEVLEAAGGKWNRKAKAHLFDADAAERIDQIILTGEITIPQDFGFYPTPPEVVARLMDLADAHHLMRVLEPSAGTGNIVKALHAFDVTVDAVELLPDNCKTLHAIPFEESPLNKITEGDFLAIEPEAIYDRVVMNPPFEKRADIKHVLHALKFLKPGGRLVSVMSAGVGFREDKLTADFRALVGERGGKIISLPDESFKASGTSVGTVIVVIPG